MNPVRNPQQQTNHEVLGLTLANQDIFIIRKADRDLFLTG